MGAAGVSFDSWRRRARSRAKFGCWYIGCSRILIKQHPDSRGLGGIAGDSRDGARAPRGFDTYNNRREARGACTLASQPLCLYTWSTGDCSNLSPLCFFCRHLAPSLSLLSRANTSPNRRFYGPPSTFNEGTLRGGIFSPKVSGLVDNFRITTSHSPFFQLLLLSVFFFSLSLDRLQI